MTETFGEVLKKAREARGVSLAEAAFKTRIREHYLLALEKNQIEALPSQAQGKGFIRLYAAFLGIPEAPLIQAWIRPDHLVIPKEDPITEAESPPKEPAVTAPEPITLSESIKNNPTITPVEKYIHTEEEPNSLSNTSTIINSSLSESQKIFIKIGQDLQKQRELLNLSLSDIERFTNIRAQTLKSLEHGQVEELSSLVQARGMLSNYAAFLNLDADRILLQFAEGLQTRRNEQYAPQKMDSRRNPAQFQPKIVDRGFRRYLSIEFIFAGLMILGLFSFVLWGAINLPGGNSTNTTEEAPSISDVLLEDTPIASLSNETAIAENSPPSTNGNENAVPGETPVSTEPIPISDLPVQVYIIAKQRAFLKITADDEVVFSGRIVPGNAYEFSALERIELLTGNAAALDIYYKQESIGFIGDVGEVKNILFTELEGAMTPTPRFTLTPTQTQIPTGTPAPTAIPTETPPLATPTVTPFIPSP
ncbi:MAG: hypothetical protein CVU39_18410 [Chloroflexi bacterium HGW-Chloroflexi-10]|nr:MAG: hypothetical protein CVU39_18410 [Chloroflexi bacterium HGW-Chloroflexi-10]